MNDDLTLVICLWLAVVCVLGWTWVPAFIAGMGGSRYDNGGSEDPSSFTSDSPDAQFWQAQLVRLGYEPIGTAWMRINFHGPAWRYQTQVRVFHSRTLQTFAFVQKQPKPLDVWWLTMLATCYQDGSLLMTNNAVDVEPEDGEYVLQGIATSDLAAVHALHLAAHQRLGRKVDRDGSLETLLTATKKHAGHESRHSAMKMGQGYLVSHALVHLFISMPNAYLMGFTHYSLPLTNLVLGCLMGLSEFMARQRAGSIMRTQMADQVRAKSVEGG